MDPATDLPALGAHLFDHPKPPWPRVPGCPFCARAGGDDPARLPAEGEARVRQAWLAVLERGRQRAMAAAQDVPPEDP